MGGGLTHVFTLPELYFLKLTTMLAMIKSSGPGNKRQQPTMMTGGKNTDSSRCWVSYEQGVHLQRICVPSYDTLGTGDAC